MEQPKHILLVDNDPLILKLFGTKLAMEGFEVLYAHDGNEGRETARAAKPDLIVTDFMMPVMDGLEMAMRLKSEKETAHIPIIFLTSLIDKPEAVKAAKEIGASEFLHKGIELSEFLAHVRKALGVQS